MYTCISSCIAKKVFIRNNPLSAKMLRKMCPFSYTPLKLLGLTTLNIILLFKISSDNILTPSVIPHLIHIFLNFLTH